jgi:uncharacterized protein YyaL (SSP411 family)
VAAPRNLPLPAARVSFVRCALYPAEELVLRRVIFLPAIIALLLPTAGADELSSSDNSNQKHRNRLADETSPYLLLHAHNPVNWYPWGEEALKKAKRENKPIFLSIGYSSCYWCHVMERESFMDEEIAKLLNEHFVCVKVDREERPDIDTIYMNALEVYQMLSRSPGGTGWPLSMFLTPDGQPFYGGTYYPARDGDRPGIPGFLTMANRVRIGWENQPRQIQADAASITAVLRREMTTVGQKTAPLNRDLIERLAAVLARKFDPEFGGFGFSMRIARVPKFPEPSNLFFLLDRAEHESDDQAEHMLLQTLDWMAIGGIRDHVGGGFHRYSVDRFWMIPHFEKMLYDNGQLASLYAEAYRLTGREDYRRVACELLDFVLREMNSPEGGFYSALDAESEKVEGKFYRWSEKEVKESLTVAQWNQFAPLYRLDAPPNFEEQFHVPQLKTSLRELAKDRGQTVGALDDELKPIRAKLLALRDRRPRPLTDTKILTAWNGLMIRGLADAGRIFREDRYTKAAGRAADFVLTEVRREDKRLHRTHSRGKAQLNGYLDDYAFLVNGLIALHRATRDKRWLEAADETTEAAIKHFADQQHGGFFFTSDDHEVVIARVKDPVDSALPSGNSVMAENLLYLAEVLDRPDYRTQAISSIRSTSLLLKGSPASAPRMTRVLAELLRKHPELEEEAEPVPPAETPAG